MVWRLVLGKIVLICQRTFQAPVVANVNRMKRTLSWLFGALAYFGPPVWAAFAIEADRKAQLASHGWVCGNPMIGIMLLAGISSCLLAFIATAFGVASFRGLSKPRSRAHAAELGVFILPLVISVWFVALLLFG